MIDANEIIVPFYEVCRRFYCQGCESRLPAPEGKPEQHTLLICLGEIRARIGGPRP